MPYVNSTPLLRTQILDQFAGCPVYLKAENLQQTGSFKLRGATNKLLSLPPKALQHGVIAASSGNHGQSVACAAARLGVKARIIMPQNAPTAKIAAVRSYKAQTELFGFLGSERDARMAELAAREQLTVIHAYQDPDVIAGQGTAALEILAAEPDITALVAPVGGGGLISGLAIAAKALRPEIQIIGVEPALAARYAASRAAGEPLAIKIGSTIADGTRTDKASPHNYPYIERFVDCLLAVTEEEIVMAVYAYAFLTKLVVEPSGALPLAALLAGKLALGPEEKLCLLISGGNLDMDAYRTWLLQGADIFAATTT